MKLSATARVGLVTLLSLLLLVVSMAWLAQVSLKPHGYRLHAIYSDVDGLLPGAYVLLMGVRIGRVIVVTPQERTVRVDMEITDRQTKILTGSQFKVLNKGIIGEKNLEIFPPEKSDVPISFLQPDATVFGDTPPRIEVALEQANKALRGLRDLANSPDARMALKDGLKNFQTAFKELNTLIHHTDEVAKGAQGFLADADGFTRALSPEDIQAVVSDLRTLTGQVRRGYESIAGHGDQFVDAKATMANLRALTGSLEGIASQVEHISSDPKVKADLRDIIANTRSMTTQVSTATQHPPKLSPRFNMSGVQHLDHPAFISGDFNLGLRLPNDAFYGGIEDIGGENFWDATWGKPDFLADGLGFHLGLVRSKIGAGLDWQAMENLNVLGEIYNPVTPEFRVSANYYPHGWGNKYGLTGAWIRGLSGTGDNRFYLGVQWRPWD